MKFYYFDVHGRGEHVRMTLWKAGVQFDDVRVTGPTWQELKQSDRLRFGQVPMLELDDGTCLFQANAITSYLGH